jgi:Fe-S-cluster containining protein
MTKEEVRIIKKYVEDNNIKMIRHFDGQNLEVKCPFRDDEKKCCAIYLVRPKICRSFKCDHNIAKTEKDKVDRHDVAFYNHISKENSMPQNVASLHSLIFNDFEYEANLLYALSNYNPTIFKSLIKNTYQLKEVIKIEKVHN